MVEVSLKKFLCTDIANTLDAVAAGGNPLCSALREAKVHDTVVIMQEPGVMHLTVDERKGRSDRRLRRTEAREVLRLSVTTSNGSKTLFWDGTGVFDRGLMGRRNALFAVPQPLRRLVVGALFPPTKVPRGRAADAVEQSAITYLQCRVQRPSDACAKEFAAFGQAIRTRDAQRAARATRRAEEMRTRETQRIAADARRIWSDVDAFFVAARRADANDSDLDQLIALVDRYAMLRPTRSPRSLADAKVQLENAERMRSNLLKHPSFAVFVKEEGVSKLGNAFGKVGSCTRYRVSWRLTGLEDPDWNEFAVHEYVLRCPQPKPTPEPRIPF